MHELLLQRDGFTVVRENPARPVQQNLLQATTSDRGPLPSFELTPPCEVTWQVPTSHADARLRFGVCILRGGFRGTGEVRIDVELDGRELLAETLPSSEAIPKEERTWATFELAIPEGGLLTVRTHYDGDQEIPPRVALGHPRIVIPFEIERARARRGTPNVVYIVIDTLRADRLHLYGNARPVSPHIDALAARGVTFDRAYASTAWTVPSTASLLTGLSPPEHGIGMSSSIFLADSLVTLPEAFQAKGYTTGAFVCNPLISAGHNFVQGFEHFRVYDWPHAEVIYEEVDAWIRAHSEQPFFLYLHVTDPHYPYTPNEVFRSQVVEGPDPIRMEGKLDLYVENFYANPDADIAELRAAIDHLLALYDAEILGVDFFIGRVLELLDELVVIENTIVAVTSDHGEEFLEHGWIGHHSQLFDPQTWVPLVIAGPRVPVGTRIEAPIENLRIVPTLLELAGVPKPRGMRARSLFADGDAQPPVFLSNSKARWADLEERRVERLGTTFSVIDKGWRLMWHPLAPGGEGRDVLTLYDLENDPGCLTDVAAEHPKRVEHLRRSIEAWIHDGLARSPGVMQATPATMEMLRNLGYIDSEE